MPEELDISLCKGNRVTAPRIRICTDTGYLESTKITDILLYTILQELKEINVKLNYPMIKVSYQDTVKIPEGFIQKIQGEND